MLLSFGGYYCILFFFCYFGSFFLTCHLIFCHMFLVPVEVLSVLSVLSVVVLDLSFNFCCFRYYFRYFGFFCLVRLFFLTCHLIFCRIFLSLWRFFPLFPFFPLLFLTCHLIFCRMFLTLWRSFPLFLFFPLLFFTCHLIFCCMFLYFGGYFGCYFRYFRCCSRPVI